MSEQEYLETKKRLHKGEKLLDEMDAWSDPHYTKSVEKWNNLYTKVLEYETVNNVPKEQWWGAEEI